MTRTLHIALAATAALLATGAAAAEAATLVALTADNRLLRIDSETRRASGTVQVRGAEGRLLGIDQRPKDGKLYGVTDAGQIVTIDPISGQATEVSRLSERFESGGRAVVDFNPVADRLRLMGMSGVNFRVNVDNGQVATDGALKYAAGTPLAGTQPRITAGAYTNSMAGAQQTALYTIDTLLGQLNLQAPPNDGVQQPKGMLGMALPAGLAFDILSDGAGANAAHVLAGGALHTASLDTGTLTAAGPVAGLPAAEIIDLAALR